MGYYELLTPGETITGERYRKQLMSLNQALKEKRPECAKRQDNGILCIQAVKYKQFDCQVHSILYLKKKHEFVCRRVEVK